MIFSIPKLQIPKSRYPNIIDYAEMQTRMTEREYSKQEREYEYQLKKLLAKGYDKAFIKQDIYKDKNNTIKKVIDSLLRYEKLKPMEVDKLILYLLKALVSFGKTALRRIRILDERIEQIRKGIDKIYKIGISYLIKEHLGNKWKVFYEEMRNQMRILKTKEYPSPKDILISANKEFNDAKIQNILDVTDMQINTTIDLGIYSHDQNRFLWAMQDLIRTLKEFKLFIDRYKKQV